MPYKSTSIKLPREYDRRVKLSDEQKSEIVRKYETGMYSQRALAREYNVSRRLIGFVIHPEKKEACAKSFVERRKQGMYKPSKEEWAAIMKEHRRYKQKLYLDGKLKTE